MKKMKKLDKIEKIYKVYGGKICNEPVLRENKTHVYIDKSRPFNYKARLPKSEIFTTPEDAINYKIKTINNLIKSYNRSLARQTDLLKQVEKLKESLND